MKRSMGIVRRVALGTAAGAALLLLLMAGGAEREHAVTESAVPAAVLQAFRQQYPGAIVHGYGKETRWLRVRYEIETDGPIAPHSLTYTPDGKMVEAEVQIPVSAVPATVQEAVKKASPTGTIKTAELTQRYGQPMYELEIVERTRVVEATFDSAGRVLSMEVKRR